MLYERWQKVVQARRNEIALRDLASGRCWTFAQLDEAAEIPGPETPAMIHPQGNSPEFIIAVLRAWRERVVVCPLEAHHQPLAVSPPRPPCCHLKTTPASRGVPRAVAFTQEQLAADADNIVTTMGLRPDWPNLGVISPAYSYGFSSLVLPLLLHGIPLFLVPSPLPVALRCAAHAHWNLTVAAVPALWHAWHKAGAILSNVRLAISAGAPLPLTLERAVFAEHGVKIHNFYGSTECGGIAYDATATPRENESSVGRPLKNVSVDIGENGALLVRSRAVGETYWPEPEPALGGGFSAPATWPKSRTGKFSCTAAPTTISTSPGAKCRRRSSSRRCANTRLSPNASFLACPAAARIGWILSWLRGGGPAQLQGRAETIPAPETAGLAGAARMVVCGIHQQQRRRQTLPRKMAARLPRKPREAARCGLAPGKRKNFRPGGCRSRCW